VLTSNRLSNLVDADLQVALVNLQNLCLLDNIVTKRTNYRLHLIHKLPQLRLLDFQKVKLKERQEAKKLFATENGQLIKAPPSPPKTFVPGEIPNVDLPETEPVPVEEPSRKGPTPEQLIAIKTAIANSQTLEEVARLEKALKQGQGLSDMVLPGDAASKTPTIATNTGVPPSTQQPEESSAMEEG